MTEFMIPTVGKQTAKAAHLVVLKEKVGVAKNAHNRCFISFEQPSTSGVMFIQTKGFYSDEPQEVIAEKFKEMVEGVDKEKVEELYFPWSEISKVKSLVYKAK
jgi:hypothetical protein